MSPTHDSDAHTPPTAPPPQDAFGDALRAHWQAEGEAADGGFSLRVMASLPHRRAARTRVATALRLTRWMAISLAALGAASLVMDLGGPGDLPHALAAGCLLGLVILWSVPHRWNP